MGARVYYKSLLLLLLVSSSVCLTKVKYNGYRVYRLTVYQDSHIQAILQLKDHGILFWGIPSLKVGGSSDFMFAPHLQGSLLQGLREVGIKVTLLHSDVQRIIDEHDVTTKRENGLMEWTAYHGLADINSFIKQQTRKRVSRSSGAVAETFLLGTSYEGRSIVGVKISTPNLLRKKKPAVWIDSNIHGREWVTSAVSTFLINELLSENKTEINLWTKYFDWYIVPVVNPDGFEYSHTTDRFWRKNRATTDSPMGCRGIDLNRNFGYHWNGTSNNSCSGLYSGVSAFSEPESLAISNKITELIKEEKVDLQMYLSLHSFSQMILLPFGFNSIKIPQHKTYMRIAAAAATAHAQRFGTRFLYGQVTDLLYPVTGCSTDWVKGVHNVAIALTYELRDLGYYGALLPPELIIPSALEFIDGLSVYLTELRKGIPEVDPPDAS